MNNIYEGKPTLFLMTAPPAAGKSTWAKKFIDEYPDVCYISRDEIRYSIINDDDDYFAHEDEVFEEFVQQINQALANGLDVIADATHNTRWARRKLLDRIKNIDDIHIIPVNFETSLRELVRRNAMRSGRAQVPGDAIESMWNRHDIPTFHEAYTYMKILNIRQDGRVEELR